MRIGRESRAGSGGARMRVTAMLLAGTGLLACVGAGVSTAEAASGRKGVLEVEVRIESGRERWKNGTEWKDGSFSQSFVLNIPYAAAPGLDNINPYDPDYDANALRQAGRAQAQGARIAGQGGRKSSPFNTVLDPRRLTQVDPERMAEFQKRAQACHNDQDCLMQVGMEMMSRNATGQDAEVMRKIREIGAECSKTISVKDRLKYDACMQEKGARYQTASAGTSNTGPGFAEPAADRFQRWETSTPCGATLLADYRYEAREKLNDVSGPAEGTQTRIGAAEGGIVPSQVPLTCSSNQLITDVVTRKLFIQDFYMPTIPVRQTIQSKLLGKPLQEQAEGGLPGGTDIPTGRTVLQWITRTLKDAPLTGRAEKAFKIKGDMNGVSRVTNASGRQDILPDATDPYAWKRQSGSFHETEFIVKLSWVFREVRR